MYFSLPSGNNSVWHNLYLYHAVFYLYFVPIYMCHKWLSVSKLLRNRIRYISSIGTYVYYLCQLSALKCRTPTYSQLSEEINPRNFKLILRDFYTSMPILQFNFVELHRNIHLERLSLQKSSVFHGVLTYHNISGSLVLNKMATNPFRSFHLLDNVIHEHTDIFVLKIYFHKLLKATIFPKIGHKINAYRQFILTDYDKLTNMSIKN